MTQPIDNGAKSGAAATVLLIVVGLAPLGVGGLVTAYMRAPQAGDVLVRSTILVPDAVLPALGVIPAGGATPDLSSVLGGDGGFVAIRAHGGQPLTGYSYWRVQVCAPSIDGGDPGPSAIPGVQIVYDDGDVGACDPAAPVIEAWQQGRSDAPFLCACAVDATCLQADGGAAPTGITIAAGGWSGAGCLPKACTEMAGASSWPAGCPQ